jgi:3-hydroxyisobutyrate dehydrogenase-like beta-hydroxyacid dehydrogenase
VTSVGSSSTFFFFRWKHYCRWHSKNGVANKSLQAMASRAPVDYEKMKPLLETLGDAIIYTGDLGSGTLIKLARNLVRRGISLAIGERNRARCQGRCRAPAALGLHALGSRVAAPSVAKPLPQTGFKGNYEAPAGFNLSLSRKEVGLVTELGRQHNVPMPITALVEQIVVQAIGRGWSEQITASLFRLQEEAASIEVREKKS